MPRAETAEKAKITNGAPKLVDQSETATSSRMTLDLHRAEDGRCVRGCGQWPCDAAIDAMYGGSAA